MLRITIKERGNVPRKMQTAFTAAKRVAWEETGKHFHRHNRDARFTSEHADKAGYTRRKGEGMSRSSKEYRRSYTGRKEARFGHTRPLELTGETRRLARSAMVTGTTKAVQIKYSGARKFNFRHPKSQINMSREFRTVAAYEVPALAQVFDSSLDQALKLQDETL
jgi:hypothetical protein